MRSGHALVLFSGGQDSTTCLAWALSQFAHVETIGFDYGQRHHVELQARHAVLEAMRSQFPQWSRLDLSDGTPLWPADQDKDLLGWQQS